MAAAAYMGRRKYTDFERTSMISMFIKTTREIIDEEGINEVTIRKVAKRCGYNSATIYLYFDDVDDLITICCISYLEEYCRAWAQELKTPRTVADTYVFAWEMFDRYAFRFPLVFHHIFFCEHSKPLSENITLYYEVFPDQLENISGAINDMLRGGALVERDMAALQPLAKEGTIRKQDVEMISVLAVSCFRSLLEEKCALDDKLKDEDLIAKHLKAVRFLINK